MIAQTPPQIAATLATRLVDLKSRQRGMPDRHRSLRAAMQGSFELMPTELRQFFALLSVFQGGWTANAAQMVAECAQAEERLEDLVARSLVAAREEESSGFWRYTFLETLRQFAAEQFSPEQKAQAAQRHADYFLGLAGNVREDDIRSLSPLDGEQENLILAVEWGQNNPAETFWKGLAGARIHAFIRGHHRVGAGWIDAVLPAVGAIEKPELRFQVRYAACLLLPDIGRLEDTERIADEMRADAGVSGDAVRAVYAAVIRGYVAEFRDSQEAAVDMRRTALAQARPAKRFAASVLPVARKRGALRLWRRAWGFYPGETPVAGGGRTPARELLLRVPPLSRRASLAPSMLAAALIYQNRKSEAYKFLKAAQQACVAQGSTSELMYAFIYECEIARERGFLEQATLLYGAFRALQERMGYSLARAESFRPGWIQNLRHDLQKLLGAETFETLMQRGKQTPPAILAAEWLPEGSLQ